MDKRISNPAQTVSVTELTIESGKARGKRCVLVHAGAVEAMFSVDNALDVSYLRYRGINLSLLTKNGLNNDRRGFISRFEGGFLYTCGMDSFSTCREGYEMHGSLHTIPCDKVSCECDVEGVTLSGTVSDTALFGQNLVLVRRYRITGEGIEINDTLENRAYTDASYVFLYHINFGYPFLSEKLKLNFASREVIGTNAYSESCKGEADLITAPVDGLPENCFYRIMDEGRVELFNEELRFGCRLTYDMNALPNLVQWKSMASGDYALGIEPATTRFSPFNMTPIKAGESANIKINVNFY